MVPLVGASIIPIILNFVLFIPFGFCIANVFQIKWNWKRVLFIGGLFSFIIESIQLKSGRYAEIDDLLMNATGALSGYLLYYFIKKKIQIYMRTDNRDCLHVCVHLSFVQS